MSEENKELLTEGFVKYLVKTYDDSIGASNIISTLNGGKVEHSKITIENILMEIIKEEPTNDAVRLINAIMCKEDKIVKTFFNEWFGFWIFLTIVSVTFILKFNF